MDVDDSMFVSENRASQQGVNDTVLKPQSMYGYGQKQSSFPTSILNARIALLATAIGGPDYSLSKNGDGDAGDAAAAAAAATDHGDSNYTTYKHGDDCLACLKDLKKWFKLVDDNQRKYEVAISCANYKILIDDLIPILLDWDQRYKNIKKKNKNKDKSGTTTLISSPYYDKIALLSLQLMVLMTWPIQLNDDSSSNQIKHHNELKKNQLLYKKIILSTNVIKPILRIAILKISIEKSTRTIKDYQIIKLVLQFLRNVLAIEPEQSFITMKTLQKIRTKTSNNFQKMENSLPNNVSMEDINLDSTISNFSQCKVFPFLLTLSNLLKKEFDQDFLNECLMEIFFYLIKNVTPQSVLSVENSTNVERETRKNKNQSNTQKKKNTELEDLLSREKQMYKTVVTHTSTRHSRFGSLISIQTPDNGRFTISGGSSKDLIEKNSILDKLDERKKWNKPIVTSKEKNTTFYKFTSSSNTNTNTQDTLNDRTLLVLQENLTAFVTSSSFNNLLKSCTDSLINDNYDDKNSNTIKNYASIFNHIQYLVFASWFIKFQTLRISQYTLMGNTDYTHLEKMIGNIDGVMQDKSIIFVTKLLRDSMENKTWSLVHANIVTLNELLLLFLQIDDFYPEDCKYLKEKLFSDDTITLISYLPRLAHKHSLDFNKSSIELTHTFLKVLEKNSNLTITRGNSKRKNININNKSTPSNRKALNDIKKNFQISDDDEAMDLFEDQMVSEKINFDRVLQKYFNDQTVKTYIDFLKKYQNLEYHDIKRTLQFFHRLFIVNKEESFLFRMDFIVLLKEMLSSEGLHRSDKIRKHLTAFADHYLIKLREKLHKSPTWYIDLLFPNLSDKSVGLYSKYGQVEGSNFLQNYLCCLPSEFKTLPDEEALPSSVILDMKFGILISTLIDDNKDDLVKEVLAHLKSSLDLFKESNAKDVVFENATILENDTVTSSIVDIHRACRGDPDYRSLLLLVGYVIPVKVVDKCYLPKDTELTQISVGINMVSKYLNTGFDTPDGARSSEYLIRYYDDEEDKTARKNRSFKNNDGKIHRNASDSGDSDEENFIDNDDEHEMHDEDYFKDLSNKKMVNQFLAKGRAVSKKSKSNNKGQKSNLPRYNTNDDEDDRQLNKNKKSSRSHIVSAAMIDDSDDEDSDLALNNPIFFENEQYMRWILDKHLGSISEEKMILFGRFTKSRFANNGDVVGDWESLFGGPVPSLEDLKSSSTQSTVIINNETQTQEQLENSDNPSEMEFSDNEYAGQELPVSRSPTVRRSPHEESDDDEEEDFVQNKKKKTGLFIDDNDD